MKKINLRETYILLLLSSLFILTAVFLPIYDDTNGFHNSIFDNYKLTWSDGKSPINFHIISNIINNKQISFLEGYLIFDTPVEKNIDFFKLGDRYYLKYTLFFNYLFAIILSFLPVSSELQLFKSIILLVILFYTLILLLFYKVQKYLGLKRNIAFISSLVAGIATSILIYSRYLFLRDLMATLTFMLLIYFTMRIWKKPTVKTDILFSFLFSSFLFSIFNKLVFFIFFIFSLVFFKYKLINSLKVYIPLSLSLIVIISTPVISNYSTPSIGMEREYPSSIYQFSRLAPLLRIYYNYIHASDYAVFGYHNQNSERKLDRYFAYIYSFRRGKGNAIFYSTHGIFGSLFGPKGFIYNSPFLIFSILGIFAYKKKDEKIKFILLIAVLFILLFGLFYPYWYGGYTPRYVRFFNIPILLLTFFSFYYLQELGKEKKSFRKYFTYALFSILVGLSILNVASLAIRADWTYEHEANLVSYDLVLWPWIEPKPKESVNLYLTSLGESIEWKKYSELEGCRVDSLLEGIVTYVCNCEYSYVNYAERTIKIPWDKINVTVKACSRCAGGDGVIGKFYFGNFSEEIFVPSDSCTEKTFTLKINSSEEQRIALKPKIYGRCNDEAVIWKMIRIKRID